MRTWEREYYMMRIANLCPTIIKSKGNDIQPTKVIHSVLGYDVYGSRTHYLWLASTIFYLITIRYNLN